MTNTQKPTLRDTVKTSPRLTPDINDVKFAGAENRSVMPNPGTLDTPDPANVVEGQNSKSN
jgi:hypothetical protein